MSIRGSISVAVVVAVLGLLVSATPALAGYVPGEPLSSFPVSSGPIGVAVDQTSGDVYVSSTNGGVGTIEEFEANGDLVNEFTVPGGGSTLYQLAVDNSTGPSKGDLYVADYGESVVYRYDKSGDLIGEIKGLEVGTAVAVDGAGDLLVGEYSAGDVIEFPPAASSLSEGKVVLEGLHSINALAVDGKGDLFVAENVAGLGTAEFAPGAGGFNPTPVSELALGGQFGGIGVAVDRATGDVFVDDYTSVQEYDEGGSPVGGSFGSFGSSNSVAVDESDGTVYAVEGSASVVDVFVPGQTLNVDKAGTGEGVVKGEGFDCAANESTCSRGYVTGKKVVLEESPAADSRFVGWSGGLCAGSTATVCDITLGAETTVTADFEELPKFVLSVVRGGSGGGAVASESGEVICGVTCDVGIFEKTRVVLFAEPAIGSTFAGWSGEGCSGTGLCEIEVSAASAVSAVFAQMPPVVSTEGSADVTSSTAVVAGKVDSNRAATEVCEFEYGPSTSYGSVADCAAVIEASTAAVPVSVTLSGLPGRTTYHYRLVARNAGGVSVGHDRIFVTGESAGEVASEEAAARKKQAEEAAAAAAAASSLVQPLGAPPLVKVPLKPVVKKTVKCARGKKLSHGKCVRVKGKKQAKTKGKSKKATSHKGGK